MRNGQWCVWLVDRKRTDVMSCTTQQIPPLAVEDQSSHAIGLDTKLLWQSPERGSTEVREDSERYRGRNGISIDARERKVR